MVRLIDVGRTVLTVLGLFSRLACKYRALASMY